MVSLITLEATEILAIISFLLLIAGYLWGFAKLISKLELKPTVDIFSDGILLVLFYYYSLKQ